MGLVHVSIHASVRRRQQALVWRMLREEVAAEAKAADADSQPPPAELRLLLDDVRCWSLGLRVKGLGFAAGRGAPCEGRVWLGAGNRFGLD
jgi:hypothetical protein